ncbi:MAG: ferritin-like domain-containing protein [Firmicutes bacterium]|nr:ferritin-like domain-containing protein [Bacillota bacterium]
MPEQLEQMVREAIADEISAVAMYSTMANMVDNLTLKAVIMSIVADEFGHARTWMTLLETGF